MKHETGTKRAVIIGGSLGGLFTANVLHRSGWDVRVFERVGAELSERGAGVVTHPELLEALGRVGIPLTDIGVEVLSRITLDNEGAVIGDYRHPQILTAWGRLYALLKGAFPAERYITDKHFTGLTQDASQVTAMFADGSSVSGDLLIGADGIRSTVREQLDPAVKPQYAGYVAWRGLLEEGALSARTHQQLFGHFGFCLPPREQILGYPVAGACNALGVGKRRYNFVWYRPADADELIRLSTDDNGKVYEQGIPPPLIAKAITEEIRAEARRVLAPQFAEVVEKTAQPFFQPIFDLESTTLAFGRVALVGDSAFVARPHCGMGVTKAFGDALALAGMLESMDVPEALARYSAERVDFGARIVTHARHLGAYMQAQLLTEHEVAMAERYRTPQAVMSETAVPPRW